MQAIVPILTPRLIIRTLCEKDIPILVEYRNHPDVARYQAWGASYSLEQAQKLVTDMGLRKPGQPGWFQFAVSDRETDCLLGDLALNTTEAHQGELGYTFAPGAQGQGYATEAVVALLGHVFDVLCWHRVTAGTDPRNLRSAALLRRLGFRHEGHFVRSFFDGISWLDDDRYALLEEEWHPMRFRRLDY